jgi:glycosyltransferase involved in cell wall biosynthesis
MTAPLVSVVTPTWQRHDVLLKRCIRSVAMQTYEHVEHIVVSDGPDDELATLVPDGVRYEALPDHDPDQRWGTRARLRGIELARGEFIAYLDDDNAFRPDHLSRLVEALLNSPAADFAYSQMVVHQGGGESLVGAAPPQYCGIDTSIIVHRRELLEQATWRNSLPTIDWDVVDRWLRAGAGWAWVPLVTVDYYK